MATNPRLVALLRPVARAIRPPASTRRNHRVDLAISDDGRPRLDRATGSLPRHVLIPTDAVTVRAEPSSVSTGANVQDQLVEQGETIVEQSVTTADTTSIAMDDTFNGTNTEISAVVNYAGSGVSELAARSDHSHAQLHDPVTVTDTGSVDLTVTGQDLQAAVLYGGSGAAATAARSDHDHAGVYSPVGHDHDGIYAPVSLTGTAALDYGSIAAQTCAALTITVTGAVIGDAVALGPQATLEAGLTAMGFVSAANTVTVRLCNVTAAAIDPASATWRATVLR